MAKKKVIEIITKKDDDLTAFYCWGLEKGVLNKILALVNGLDIEVKQSEVPGLMAIEPPFMDSAKELEQDIKEGNTVPVKTAPVPAPAPKKEDKAPKEKKGFEVPNALAGMEVPAPAATAAPAAPVDEIAKYAKAKDIANIRAWALKYAASEDMELIKQSLEACRNNLFKTALLKYLAQRGIYDSSKGFEKGKYEKAVKDALSAELTDQVKEDLMAIYKVSLKPFMLAKKK